MGLEEAIEADDRFNEQRGFANYVSVDESGVYNAPLHKPGTYTLLLMTARDEEFWRKTYHEARVVEVPESGELNLDFNLTP